MFASHPQGVLGIVKHIGSSAAVSIRNVSKIFVPAPHWLRLLVKSPINKNITALDSVNLEVRPGQICALVGPNGAGKTTLFRILVGLTTPTAGVATVYDLDVVKESLPIRRQVGWMPTSDQTLFQRHTSADNLRFHGRLHGFSGSNLDKAVDEALEMVDLRDAANNAVVSFSAGMKARLQLARALLHRPRILILDEPTASVDPVASYGLINLILDIVKERRLAAIVSSHRLDEIETLHSHVVLLHRGKVLFDGDLDDLRAKIDKTHIEFQFTSQRSASAAATSLSGTHVIESIEERGAAMSLVLNHGTPVGAVLKMVKGDPNDLIAVREIKVPLREVLADVYGVGDGRARDTR